MSRVAVTDAEYARIAEARRILDEVNAGLAERGAPVTFVVTTARSGLLAEPDGTIMISSDRAIMENTA